MPYPLLEGATAQIERQALCCSGLLALLDGANHGRHPLFEAVVTTNQLGLCETILQLTYQLCRIIPQRDGTNAAIGRRDQNGSQPALPYAKVNLAAAAATPASCSSRAARRPRLKASVEHRIGDRATLRQLTPQLLRTARYRIGFGSDTQMRLEQAMEVETAHPDLLCQALQ